MNANAWKPDGVYWDMMDDNTHNKDTSYIGGLGIIDPVADTVLRVKGVTNFHMFKAVTQNAPTDILTVRDYIKTAYPNQAVQIDSLYKEYGY